MRLEPRVRTGYRFALLILASTLLVLTRADLVQAHSDNHPPQQLLTLPTDRTDKTGKIIWTAAAKGIEYAQLPIVTFGKQSGSVLTVRIDPQAVLFRIYFDKSRKTIPQWSVKYPGAVLIINANFFHPNGTPIGLVRIGDDILNPATGRPDSGLFTVRSEVPEIGAVPQPSRVPTATPKPETTPKGVVYSESFESFPFLVRGAQPINSYADDTAMQKARRTVIAQDDMGRILIFLTWPTELTLPEMSDWLLNSGFPIINALNLDGGASSQIHLGSVALPQAFQGGAAVPVILAVYPR